VKRSERLLLLGALILMGLAWGAAFPLAKIAVSTGYRPFGIMVWQLIVGVAVSGAIIAARGRPITLAPRFWGVFLGIALLGSVIPNAFSYTAAAHIPAGVLSIIIALVPLFALPITLALGFERASLVRFAGLALGAVAVALLILPGDVFLAMGAALAYAGEGNFLTWYGNRGLDADRRACDRASDRTGHGAAHPSAAAAFGCGSGDPCRSGHQLAHLCRLCVDDRARRAGFRGAGFLSDHRLRGRVVDPAPGRELRGQYLARARADAAWPPCSPCS